MSADINHFTALIFSSHVIIYINAVSRVSDKMFSPFFFLFFSFLLTHR